MLQKDIPNNVTCKTCSKGDAGVHVGSHWSFLTALIQHLHLQIIKIESKAEPRAEPKVHHATNGHSQCYMKDMFQGWCQSACWITLEFFDCSDPTFTFQVIKIESRDEPKVHHATNGHSQQCYMKDMFQGWCRSTCWITLIRVFWLINPTFTLQVN